MKKGIILHVNFAKKCNITKYLLLKPWLELIRLIKQQCFLYSEKIILLASFEEHERHCSSFQVPQMVLLHLWSQNCFYLLIKMLVCIKPIFSPCMDYLTLSQITNGLESINSSSVIKSIQEINLLKIPVILVSPLKVILFSYSYGSIQYTILRIALLLKSFLPFQWCIFLCF